LFGCTHKDGALKATSALPTAELVFKKSELNWLWACSRTNHFPNVYDSVIDILTSVNKDNKSVIFSLRVMTRSIKHTLGSP